MDWEITVGGMTTKLTVCDDKDAKVGLPQWLCLMIIESYCIVCLLLQFWTHKLKVAVR